MLSVIFFFLIFEFDSLVGNKQILIESMGVFLLECDFFRGTSFLTGELRTGVGRVASVLLVSRMVGDTLELANSLILLSFNPGQGGLISSWPLLDAFF